MATGNLFQGLAKGSVGDVVFYRNNGKQVSRVRNRQVKNPQTGAQMAQRCVMSAVSKAYSKMKYICDHSFEGVSYGARSMAMFMKLNADRARQSAIGGTATESWVCKGHNVAPVLPLQVSSGSLASRKGTFTFRNNANGGVTNSAIMFSSVSPAEDADYKADEFLKGINLGAGDMLTFIGLASSKPGTLGDDTFKTINTRLVYFRIKVKDVLPANLSEIPWNSEDVLDFEDSNLAHEGESALEVPSDLFVMSMADGGNGDMYPTFSVGAKTLGAAYLLCGALIASKKQGNSYLRSSEILELNDANMPEWLGESTAFDTALQSYMVGGGALGDNPYYLNGGEL